MMDTHSLTMTLTVCSLKLTSSSALLVFGVVGVVCVTAVAMTAVAVTSRASSSRKKKNTENGECVKPRNK